MQTSPRAKPVLVAITGGSGSGKTWLAAQLERALAPRAARLSLDDFYRDHSHLSPARRARLNFDHPRAIDWPAMERVIRELLSGRPAAVPGYDFTTHCRLKNTRLLSPKPIILLDGLWLLRRPSLRRLFSLRIFLDCPFASRLQRRMARDLVSRGRTRSSIAQQFRRTVEPMHALYVEPQSALADVVFKKDCTAAQVRGLARLISRFLPAASSGRRGRRTWPNISDPLIDTGLQPGEAGP